MKILIVEDTLDMQLTLKQILAPTGAEVTCADDLRSAREYLDSAQPDLILLDANLPDGDGFQFMSEMNAGLSARSIPVVFITGQAEVTSKVAAFAIGAEDYIVKPFNHLEVKARLEAKIRRIANARNSALHIQEGALQIDIARQRVYVVEGNLRKPVTLTGKEFQILVLLAKNEGRVLTRNQILDSVWGAEVAVLDRTIDTHVSGIRKKLGAVGHYVESVQGSGYRFVAKATPAEKKSA